MTRYHYEKHPEPDLEPWQVNGLYILREMYARSQLTLETFGEAAGAVIRGEQPNVPGKAPGFIDGPHHGPYAGEWEPPRWRRSKRRP